MTDIGPGQNGVIAKPSFEGPVPTGFAITGVKHEGEPFTGELFTIDGETGEVSVMSSSDTPIGMYLVSVSCQAAGVLYEFPDIIEVEFLKPVPEGITVEPQTLQADYSVVKEKGSVEKLPTAVVKTDGEHISIKKYEISNVTVNGEPHDNTEYPLFSISEEGVISIIKGCETLRIGKYVIDLRLTTALTGSESEEGLFKNALEVNIISKPLGLSYEGENVIEEETEANPEGSFTSQVPVLDGSTDGVVYSIAAVSPEKGNGKFIIDEKTGVVSVAPNHGFKKGEKYSVSVKVVNDYCAEGVVFDDVLKLSVVEYIEPISDFSYADVERIEGLEKVIEKNTNFKGTYVAFEFDNLDAKYEENLTIDKQTGTVTLLKGNNLEVGNHTITVKATNLKGSVTATISLKITANPNKFTYISYGNNISEDQTCGGIYDNQFRFATKAEMRSKGTVQAETNLNEGHNVQWSMKILIQKKDDNVGEVANLSGVSIDSSTGALTFANDANINNNKVGIILVTATAYQNQVDEEEAYSLTVPVGIYLTGSMKTGNNCNGVTNVDYTPFILRVNPATGGRFGNVEIKQNAGSNTPVYLNFKRYFNYFNIGGVRKNGTPLEDGHSGKNATNQSAFLKDLWGDYLGSNVPVSFVSKLELDNTLCYIDNNNNHEVVVNPGKWYDDGWADGIFFGDVMCTNNSIENIDESGALVTPFAIWFDKDYNAEQ